MAKSSPLSNLNGKKDAHELTLANQSVWKNLRFERFRSQGLHCDIILSASHPASSPRARVKAHKIILAEASPFFSHILGQTNSVESSGKHFNVPHIEKLALEHLIKFIYTGTLTLSNENLLTIFEGSKLLKLEEATRKCKAFLVEGLNTKNVWERFKLSMKMGAINLSKIIRYIQNSWDSVTSCTDFLELTDKDLMCLAENTCKELAPSVFKSINDWVNHNEDIRKASLLNLLEVIPLKAIPAHTLVKYFNSRNRKDIPGIQDFARKTIELICLMQEDIISSNKQNQTQVRKNNVFVTPVKKEEEKTDDEDDVIFLPTPPNQTTTMRPIKVSSSPDPVPESDPSLFPTQPITPKQGLFSQNPSPCASLSRRKRKSQLMSTPRCNKISRPEIIMSPENSVVNFATPSYRNVRPVHSNPNSSGQGRLICINNEDSIATLDIAMIRGFQFTKKINKYSVYFNDSVEINSCVVYYCNKLCYVGGGLEDNVATDDVITLDLVKKVLKNETKLVQARFNHTVVEFEGHLYTIGGSSGKHGLNSVERLDLDLQLRTGKPSLRYEVHPMIFPREAHGTAVYERTLYVIGGYSQTSDGSGTCLDTMECYDLQSNRWNPKSSMRLKRCGMAVAVFDDKLYVIGGGNELKAKKKLQSVEVYNFKTDKWTCTKSLNCGRQYASAVVLDGTLYVVGGDCPNNPTVEVFSPFKKTWEFVTDVLTNQDSFTSIAAKP